MLNFALRPRAVACRLVPGLLLAVAGSVGCAVASAAPPTALALRIESVRSMPADPSPARDIRWASDDSVYLERPHAGVSEVAVRSRTRPVEPFVVPDDEHMGFRLGFASLGVSSEYLVVSAVSRQLAWRARAPEGSQHVDFHRIELGLAEDLDVAGDRLLVLGIVKPEHPFGASGGVAWLGSIGQGLKDLKPVLQDVSGPGAASLGRCSTFEMGAVRFLLDGGFVVVPGFQPGAFRYTADGQLAQSWDTAQLGIDSGSLCGNLTRDESSALRVSFEKRFDWLNRYRIVDDVLALPDGPGLIVRSVVGGLPRWELKVLGASGVVTYQIPVQGEGPTERMRGDVHNGRIALLVSDHASLKQSALPDRLVLATLPSSLIGVAPGEHR